MTEHEQKEPYLSPEYWNPHAPGDECTPYRKKKKDKFPIWIQIKRRGFARSVLLEYFAQPNRTPMLTLTAGDVFDPQSFPMGTVAEVAVEQLSRERNDPLNPVYRSSTMAGVVYTHGDKSMLLSFDEAQMRQNYTNNKDAFEGVPGYQFRLPLTIGQVDHNVRKNGDDFSRVSRIKLYGRGGDERRPRRRAALPRKGLIFRPVPQGGMA